MGGSMADSAVGFIAVELFAATALFVVFPGVSAAVLATFWILVGRQLGARLAGRRVWEVALACALVAPLPELFVIDFWPPDASVAWHVGTWVTLLPASFAGAFLATWVARRFEPQRDEVDAGESDPAI